MKTTQLLLLAGLFFLGANSSAEIELMKVKQGTLLPEIDIKTVDGMRIGLETLKGKITVIVFWKAGQDDYQSLLGELCSICKQYGKKGVMVLAVNGDNAPEEQVRNMVTSRGPHCYFAGDPDMKTSASLGIFALPTTLIIGPDLKIVFIHSLFARNFSSLMEANLKYLLGEITEAQMAAQLHPEKAVTVSRARIKAERYVHLGSRLLENPELKDRAISALTTAAEADPSYYKPHAMMARIYLEDGMVPKAVAEMEIVFNLSPCKEFQDDRLLTARQLADRGANDQALSIYESYLAEHSNPPAELYFRLGRIHEMERRIPMATEAYEKAVETILEE